ncbi:mitochondrial fission process protein 1-like isoform X2 [Watersipora subatra]|uniref:mitochondrial fission process protein 1-like isoform X2 n=1 Tax=Watersipora subatra TaxID=2589382 RepID=UPI00355B1F76
MDPAEGDKETPAGDIFRDYPVRYLGYANEVGEAFRSFVHVNVVRASYVVASCYVMADAAHKGQVANKKGHQLQRRYVLQGVVDTLIWQGLASVVIPGFTINRICWLSNKLLRARLPLTTSKSLSTMLGLAAIPLIISPIDKGVDSLMENTFRSWFKHVEALDEKEIVHHNRKD